MNPTMGEQIWWTCVELPNGKVHLAGAEKGSALCGRTDTTKTIAPKVAKRTSEVTCQLCRDAFGLGPVPMVNRD